MTHLSSFVRRQGLEAFKEMRYQGMWTSLKNALTGQPNTLPAFDQIVFRRRFRREYQGLQAVPLQQIVGSLGRAQDFGPGFRPRRKFLQDRWVAVFALAREDRWEPVHLLKVGPQYFVEDGNHRVSVAHYLGRSFIDAEVWEHPVIPTLTLQGRCEHCGQLVTERV